MILKSKVLAALVLVIMFGGISLSSALGWWETESTKEAAEFTDGEFAGEANPADIRGSYTFGDVENNFDIPAVVLAQAFGVQTDDPEAFQVKSLEEIYANREVEIGTASVRLFVAFYNGLPIDLSAGDYLLQTGTDILMDRNLSEDRIAYLETHTLPNEPNPVDVETTTPTEEAAPEVETTPEVESTHSPETEQVVKGKTTFAELLEWGISEEKIVEVLGMPMPEAVGMTVKDYCTQNGLSFETIKTALQTELDQ